MADERYRRYMTGGGRTRIIYRRGNSGLRKTLRQLDGQLKTNLGQGMKQAADLVLKEAQSRVKVKTGRLRDALEVRLQSGGISALIGIFRRSISRGIKHHNAIEFGTRFTEAQPYLLPAIEAKRAGVMAILKGTVGRILASLGAKL